MSQDDLTAKQKDYAIFLPAISGFYATYIGKQRNTSKAPYVDPSRFPAGITDMEQFNWLNAQKGIFPYKWSLYSGGHANLNLNKQDWTEEMVRTRDPNTVILGDSGGFQIGKGKWEGDWRAPNSAEVQVGLDAAIKLGVEVKPVLDATGNPVVDKNGNPKTISINHEKEFRAKLAAADKKRTEVLNWLDNIANYSMILDIPTWIVREAAGMKATGITTHQEAVDATKYNNEYFINNRKGVKNGGTKFLNVLQGSNHTDADDWYETMKHYCDPNKYPDRHFDGWAMGGQNMCDVHLVLKRLTALRFDGLLQEGKHDWMHFLGTSRLEWAVLLTAIQRSVRRHVNPNFTISFDCASPFLATANGQVYCENTFPADGKWSYRMQAIVDDKKYASDTRSYRDAILQDKLIDNFEDSPVSSLYKIKDICYYKPNDLNKLGKVGKSSWDSFSYFLLMSHNVWMHLTAVQEANRKVDAGEYPAMVRYSAPSGELFADVVERIFAAPTRDEANAIIEQYSSFWMEIVGTRGFSGKKSINANTMFNALFDAVDEPVADEEPEFDESKLDQLEEDAK
jgi:hypothetical protein